MATITTTIEDPKAQEAFLNSFMGTSKPTKVGATNDFETKYVLPNEIMHGNALLMTGIPIQATPPDSNINKYWYDTSSGKATLKLYDGTNWVEVNLGGSSASEDEEETIEAPSRAIIMWSGSIASIPIGWVLCDGTNGTPDLRNRFVIGSGDIYPVGTTGGSKDAIVVAHTHTGTTSTNGAHTHSSSGAVFNNNGQSIGTGAKVGSTTTSSAGAHSHTLTINSAGSSGTNANLPPYYALAFIMKL